MISHLIRSLLGAESVVDKDALGVPRVAPRTEEECALILSTAAAEGWRVRAEGVGTWIPRDAPADLALTTRRLSGVTQLDSADLVTTVQAGTVWDDLRAALADHGVWVPVDPPGAGRTVGSVVATATAGSLRTGFGTLRDQLLGLTLVTGDGRVLRVGGRVAKNVAGFDLTKLATGSFGAFGIVTSVHFRLRAVPRADLTLVANGERDALLGAARAVLDSGTTPAALEIISPKAAGTPQWTLAVRILGSDTAVATEHSLVRAAATPLTLQNLEVAEAAEFWRSTLAGATQAPTTLRLGALTTALDEALDTVAHHLDEDSDDWVMVNVLGGAVRWSGSAPVERLQLLRHAAAQREMPVTLERAPWIVRDALGHFGAYREGVARVIDSLRRSFDPVSVLVIPLGDGL